MFNTVLCVQTMCVQARVRACVRACVLKGRVKVGVMLRGRVKVVVILRGRVKVGVEKEKTVTICNEMLTNYLVYTKKKHILLILVKTSINTGLSFLLKTKPDGTLFEKASS